MNSKKMKEEMESNQSYEDEHDDNNDPYLDAEEGTSLKSNSNNANSNQEENLSKKTEEKFSAEVNKLQKYEMVKNTKLFQKFLAQEKGPKEKDTAPKYSYKDCIVLYLIY